jgi:hypothetical protein
MNLKKTFLIVTAFFCGLQIVQAQSDTTEIKPVIKKEDKPLKFNLNDDGSHYFQATFLNQTWVRFNESNPGTTVLGQKQDNTFDIGLRRTRIQMFGQITDRAFVYFQFGLNNFNRMTGTTASSGTPGNRKVQAYFHDALGEYRVTKGNELKLGGGLTITNGLSRFSNPSVGTILALDLPVFAQATVDQTDLFSRKLSIYARGQVGKIDYRVSLSDPFPVNSAGGSSSINTTLNASSATFAGKKHYLQEQAYVMYQFWEKEGHTTPYMTGSYLGKKKVLNLGAGIIYQPSAMWIKSGNPADSIKYQDMLLWSVEGFMDTPLNPAKGTALTAYLGYFNTNYGTNYIRVQQQMNPADANSTIAGINQFSKGGNGWPMFGTGNIVYAQIGYLFKRDLLGNQGTLQPYATFQRNDFDALKDPVNVYDLGVNWLINGHKAKVSFDYQNRPVYNGNSVSERRGCYILQYQIYI